METETKIFYKSPLFWPIVIGTVAFLCAVIFVVGALSRPSPNASSDDSTGQETSTETTLPPPAANPIGMGDFAMENGYLYCLSTPSVLGIDVSTWQGEIDWAQVKDAGIQYVMIRGGYRGSESGVVYEDDRAKANYAGASAAGIKVGAYFFSQAISVEEALEEADFLLNLIKDWQVDMPVVFDWEYIDPDARTQKVDARTLTDCIKAFCNKVRLAGYQPMVYFNADLSFKGVHLRELTDYGFWLAQYDTVLNYPYKIDMWQYTETGSVPGIPGNVDINLHFPYGQ